MTKKIKIAQVGTNSMTHASQTFASIRKQNDIFELIGVAEPIDEWKHNLNTPLYRDTPQYTMDELLRMDDLDAVAVEGATSGGGCAPVACDIYNYYFEDKVNDSSELSEDETDTDINSSLLY